MTRSRGLVALTRRRFATPRSAAAVIVALTLIAAFLVAAAPRALTDMLHRQVAFQIDQLAPVSRDLSATVWDGPSSFGPAADEQLTADWPEGAGAVFGALAESLVAVRQGAGDEVIAVIDHAQFFVSGGDFEVFTEPVDTVGPRTMLQLLADPAMREHLTLAEGAWPAPWDAGSETPLQIVLTSAVAERLSWTVGQVRHAGGNHMPLILVSGRAVPDMLGVELVGIVTPATQGDPRWDHLLPTATVGTLFDDGNSRPIVTGGAYIDPGSWRSAPVDRSVVSVWFPLSPDAVAGTDPEALRAQLRGLTGQSLAIGGEQPVRARFSTDVLSTLTIALQRAHATTATLAVAAVGPIAVSVALILLAASLVVRRRRGDLILLAARGTSLSRLRGLLLIEGLLLGLAPAILSAAAATVLVPGDAGPWPMALALAIGFVPALAYVAVLTSAVLDTSRADLDSPRRSRWTRLVQLIVLILAGIAAGLLVSRGVGRSTSSVDPLVVAAPLLATAALGLIIVRLHPLWLRLALRRAQRGRGAVALVGAARSLRDPAAGSTAVLAMLVAVAIAVFSAVILATVDRGAVVAAERATGGDISVSGPIFDDDAVAAIADLPGVAHAAPIATAGRMPLSTTSGHQTAAVFVTDLDALAAVQERLSIGIDAAGVRIGAAPTEVLASSAVASEVGTGVIQTSLGELDIVRTLDSLPGGGSEATFLLMDAADHAAIGGQGAIARTVVISLAPGADTDAVSAAISAEIGGSHVLRTLESRVEAMQSQPAVSALRATLLGALALSVLLSVVAVLLVAGVSRDSRSRVVALLRTMGAGTRDARGVITWEFGPLGLSALVGGLSLGVVLPLLVLASVDLRPFTGGVRQPGLTIDPVLTLGLIFAVVAALAIAVIGGVLSARTTSLVTVLRTEEDR